MMTLSLQPLVLEIAAILRTYDKTEIPLYTVYAALRFQDGIPNYSDARRNPLHPRHQFWKDHVEKHPRDMFFTPSVFDNRNITWGLKGIKLVTKAKDFYVWKNAHGSDNWGLLIGLAPTKTGTDLVHWGSWISGDGKPPNWQTLLMIAALNANKDQILPHITNLEPGDTWYGEHFVRTHNPYIPSYQAAY